LQAYQIMPNDELLSITQVQLVIPAAQILSRPSVRVTCEVCGEEIINQRELVVNGQIVCRACAGQAYYRTPVYMTLDAPHPVLE
jgi:formylmethanofuran dehydrogenase subunit E